MARLCALGGPARRAGRKFGLMNSEKQKVLLFIVAYNEEKNLGPLISEIREKVKLRDFECDLVVVDDGSSDATSRVARESSARVLRHPVNLGIGAAEQTGLLFAKKHHFDIAVRIDGDGQHPPESVEVLIAEVAGGRCHVSIGSRFVDEAADGFKSTRLRRIGIKYFSFLCRLLSGKRVKDPTSGFRCFGRESIGLLTQIPSQDFPEVESFIDITRCGLDIKEVPAAFRSRKEGFSSIKFHHSVYYIVKVTLAILVASMRKKPEKERAENA